MLIWSLCRNFELYSSRRIREEAEGLGHCLEEIDTGRLAAVNVGGRAGLLLDGRPTQPPDAVVYRSGYTRLAFGWDLSLWRQLESLGVTTLNTTAAVLRCSDKFYTLQLLCAAGLPTVDAVMVREERELTAAVEMLGGFPLVLKWSRGTRGVGTALIESPAALRGQWQLSAALEQQAHLERFYGDAGGRDRRLFVVGGRVAAAFERSSLDDDFRANAHRGGPTSACSPSAREIDLAEEACRLLDLEVAGVDLLPTEQGPRLVEVNSVPGLRFAEEVSGVNLARALIVRLESLHDKRQSPAG